jgi:plasmid stabilization system protein ParE
MRSQPCKKSLNAVRTSVEHEIFSEEVRQLLYGKSKNIYRVLFTIRDTTVHVLFVRHSAQALLTVDELDDLEGGI